MFLVFAVPLNLAKLNFIFLFVQMKEQVFESLQTSQSKTTELSTILKVWSNKHKTTEFSTILKVWSIKHKTTKLSTTGILKVWSIKHKTTELSTLTLCLPTGRTRPKTLFHYCTLFTSIISLSVIHNQNKVCF